MPAVSILMPFKNSALWIEETVESIRAQSVANWELIAINDHAKDGSEVLLNSYNDPRIKVLSNRGQGIIAALQTGLTEATGTFITRMDSDDVMPPLKLARLIALVSESDERLIATGKVQYFSESIVSDGYKAYEDWLNQRVELGDHYDHIYRECVVASPNWMVRRSHLIEDCIFDRLQYPEDYDMVFHWQAAGYEIRSTTEITHLWHEHPKRTSRNSDIYDQASFFRLKLSWFRKHFPEIRSLALFGANQKGKHVIGQLGGELGIRWYDLDAENYRAGIDGRPILDPTTCTEPYALIAVYPKEKEALESFLREKNLFIGTNAWYV